MQTGQKIRESRIKQGLTQQELAAATNISLRTIQRIENGEVIPRSYTLKTIASVLKIDESEIFELVPPRNAQQNSGRQKMMLVWLHLSALLLLPAFLIWIFERIQNDDINYHGADVINFQLSMLAYLIPCMLLPGLPQIIAVFTVIVVLVNTVRVIIGKSYYYPFTIRMIKTQMT
ncbi:helix-turn-helix domain-containing protein [Dyadobacter sp. CY347]|uniref:helix-turn-helix domain-containing protein n=1 Tax=Dyadobacter sp. CY347 TaxID=2909336 RepID=UPI001F20C2E2|nr:helix-turn-helix domain-containing protein [Dyadobacter sp. CY347]MCF2491498.1 helix-turn-helix domain-containing protein [Dyadobacter sp. CY347]